MPTMTRIRRGLAVLALVVSVAVLAATPGSATSARAAPRAAEGALASGSVWRWPTTPARIVAPFVAPAHDYGPGHRGIDLAAHVGSPVTAPADGVVAFVGAVAGRPLLTIDHDGGLVTTLEPVVGSVTAGQVVRGGDVVGSLGVGGHAADGTLHFGVREHGVYINPLRLLGEMSAAVLLPCCQEPG